MHASPFRWVFRLAPLVATVVATPLVAQNSATNGAWNPLEIMKTETYVKPPAEVERMIMAPRTDISFTAPNATRKWFLRATAVDRGDIQAYGKPHIYLGGVIVDTMANRARSLTTSTKTGLVLVDPRTNTTRAIETPKGATISSETWSPNGEQIAYIANFDNASYVYVADAATGKSAQMGKFALLATLVTTLDWTADSKYIAIVVAQTGRGPAPTHGKNGVEDGPMVRLTNSRALPQPVHFSLLQDPHDNALLKYYTTGQLAMVDVKAKSINRVGSPAMIRSVDVSPDGHYFRVTRMVEPFSYLVPVSNFGTVQELWDELGHVVTTLGKTELREGAGGGDGGDTPAFGGRGGAQAATDTGKRNIQWNPVGPGLVYQVSVFGGANNSGGDAAPANGGRGGRGGRAGGAAAPGGAAGAAAQRPQPTSIRYMSWSPPFGPNDTKLIYEGGPQLGSIAYSADGKIMFVSDSGSVSAIRVAEPARRFSLGRGITLAGGGGGFGGRGGGGGRGGAAADTLAGTLAMKTGANGQSYVVVGTDGKSVAVTGTRMPGAKWNMQGPRPWLDKINFETMQRTRVFDGPADAYDEFVTPLDDDYSQFIYTHESRTTIADAYMRDVAKGTSTKLTSAVDVGPSVTGAVLKRFQVTRPRDGNKIWVDVTLPREWKPGNRVPGIIWFYPREFTSQASYDSSRFATNINKFPEIPALRPASSTKLWVSQGYALIEPDIPIFGETGRMNDNYTRDLKENLDAVLDAIVDSGFVSRDKMGIGGHSYGAFSTVNALTLVPYFKAGIAGDGMYNRSLTPFGFQSERRNFYQAQDTYLDMSPFFRADKISGALLMYHATEDQNQGTALISSERMMAALQGLGKPAALYMYPYEDHSVATYASDLDLWARWFAWFDVYVKNPKMDPKAIVP